VITLSATFTLPIPPSANAIWRSNRGRTHLSAKYKSWIASAGLMLNSQRVPTINPPYQVEYAVGRPDKRRRDVTNFVKALDDLLQNCNVITNDSEIIDSRIYWSADVEAGQVRGTVRTA